MTQALKETIAKINMAENRAFSMRMNVAAPAPVAFLECEDVE